MYIAPANRDLYIRNIIHRFEGKKVLSEFDAFFVFAFSSHVVIIVTLFLPSSFV